MLKPVRYENGVVYILDQRRLPLDPPEIECREYPEVAAAIRDMAVRGAPAIGITAAYGMALAARRAADEISRGVGHRLTDPLQADPLPIGPLQAVEAAGAMLRATRPTAVNLFWAIERMLRVARAAAGAGAGRGRATAREAESLAEALENEARAIDEEDVRHNQEMGEHGSRLVRDGASILTHCNAGALATGGHGTALGVIRTAWGQGKRIRVYADETRPLLQGARITAWELARDGIPVTVLTDNMAGYLMKLGRVDMVIVGADRIAANGDVANKIGTYSLAVLAREHGVPFYVAAPGSTVDLRIPDGNAIPIEERPAYEVTHLAGNRVAPEGVEVFNPAFDVTPAALITAVITEKGVIRQPLAEGLQEAFATGT